MANSPDSITVTNPDLAAEIIKVGQRLIEIGMGLRDHGFVVPVEYAPASNVVRPGGES